MYRFGTKNNIGFKGFTSTLRRQRSLSTSSSPNPPPATITTIQKLTNEIHQTLETKFNFAKFPFLHDFVPIVTTRLKCLDWDLMEMSPNNEMPMMGAVELSFENAVKISMLTGLGINTLLFCKDHLCDAQVDEKAVCDLQNSFDTLNRILAQRIRTLSNEALSAPVDKTPSNGLMLPFLATLGILVPITDKTDDGISKLIAILEVNSIQNRIPIDGRLLLNDSETAPSHYAQLERHIDCESLRRMYLKHRQFSLSFSHPVTYNHQAQQTGQGIGILQIGATVDRIVDLHEGSLSFLPLVTNNTSRRYHWVTEVDSIIVGEHDVHLDRPLKVALDPLIPVSLMSESLTQRCSIAFLNMLEKENESLNKDQSAGLVSMGLRLTTGGHAYTAQFSPLVKPFSFPMTLLEGEERRYVDDLDIVLGLNFLSHFVIVFDEKNVRVGLGQMKEQTSFKLGNSISVMG